MTEPTLSDLTAEESRKLAEYVQGKALSYAERNALVRRVAKHGISILKHPSAGLTLRARFKAKSKAPNYRQAPAISYKLCRNCEYFQEDSTCRKFDFKASDIATCDAWEPK